MHRYLVSFTRTINQTANVVVTSEVPRTDADVTNEVEAILNTKDWSGQSVIRWSPSEATSATREHMAPPRELTHDEFIELRDKERANLTCVMLCQPQPG